MRTVALAARKWLISTWIASGARPLFAPPVTMQTFRPEMISQADLLYVCLHGLPDQPFWYGSTWETAVSADQLRAARLDGAVVYLAGCWGQGPMADALLAAGARAVVGDVDQTWAGYVLPTGSNGFGRLFVAALRRGETVDEAVIAARRQFLARDSSQRARALVTSVSVLGEPDARLAVA